MFKKKSIELNHDVFSIPEDDLLVTDAPIDWYAIVSHKISKDGLPIRFMYREEVDKEAPSFYSGWIVFSGTEDDSYVNNPDNFSFFSLTRLVHYQPNTSGIFWEDVGSVFEIKDGEYSFTPVNDWNPLVD